MVAGKRKFCFSGVLFSLALSVLPAAGFAIDVIYVINEDSVVVVDAANPLIVLGTFPNLAGPTMGSQITVVVNPQGTRLYTAGFLAENSVAAFDIDQSTGLLTPVAGSPFTVGFAQPFGIAVSPDGSTVYVSNFDSMVNTIAIYNSDLSSLLGTVATMGANPATIELSPDGAYLYAACAGSSEVARFDVLSVAPYLNNEMLVGSLGSTPYVVALNADGSQVYVSHVTGNISRFNADLTGGFSAVPGVTGLSMPIGIAFDPDGSRIYVASAGNHTIGVLDPLTFIPVIAPLSSQGVGPYGVAVNPDGSRLVATNAGSGELSVRELIHNTYTPVAGSPYMNLGSLPYRIAFFSSASLGAPVGLEGSQLKNNFGLFFEYYNRLRWQPPANGTAAGYYVYRNGERIAALLSGRLEYEDHNRPEGSAALYEVSAFDSSGDESAVAYIQVP